MLHPKKWTWKGLETSNDLEYNQHEIIAAGAEGPLQRKGEGEHAERISAGTAALL